MTTIILNFVLGPPKTTTETNHLSLLGGTDLTKSSNNITAVKQQSQKAHSVFINESSSKVTEISSIFSGGDKTKSVTSTSPPKPTEHFRKINSVNEQSHNDFVQISKKDFLDLKSKVRKRRLRCQITC